MLGGLYACGETAAEEVVGFTGQVLLVGMLYHLLSLAIVSDRGQCLSVPSFRA